MLAIYWAYHATPRKNVWRCVAFVTHYSSISLDEALNLDTFHLLEFAEELGQIIREENAPAK